MSSIKVEKIEINSEGVIELLKSAEVVDCVRGYASQVASSSGGEVCDTIYSSQRAIVSVKADNEDNSLLKSL